MYRLFIKHYRNLRKMSQEQLAERCGLDRSYISKLEQENVVRVRSPRLTRLEDLALALEVCPNSILRYVCETCPLNEDCKKKEYIEYDDSFEEDYNFYI